MDVNIILNGATQFLQTPQGQKFLETLEIDNIGKITEAIKLAQKANVVNGQEVISTEIISSDLTAERKKRIKKRKKKNKK